MYNYRVTYSEYFLNKWSTRLQSMHNQLRQLYLLTIPYSLLYIHYINEG